MMLAFMLFFQGMSIKSAVITEGYRDILDVPGKRLELIQCNVVEGSGAGTLDTMIVFAETV